MNIKESQELKQLKTRKTKLEVEVKDSYNIKCDADKRYNDIKKKLKTIDEQIKKLSNNKNINITEHAIIRYLERSKKIDLNQINNEILSESLKKQIKSLNSGKFPITNGLKAIVKNYSIVSVI